METVKASDTLKEMQETYGRFNTMVGQRRLLSKEEEFNLARLLEKTRAQLWYALLGYAPYTDGIADFAEGRINKANENRPDNEKYVNLDALRKASRAYRDRRTTQTTELWNKARFDAAIQLGEADRSNDIAHTVLKMLDASHAFGKQKARDGSKPFEEYKKKAHHLMARLLSHKNEFHRCNIFLAISVARKYNFGSVPFDDLTQQSQLGLMRAVEMFDWKKGFRFSTYATWWIRHFVCRYIDNHGGTIRIPSNTIKLIDKVKKARQSLSQSGKKETVAAICKETGMSEKQVKKILSFRIQTFSLDDKPSSNFDKESDFKEFLPEPLIERDNLADDQVGLSQELDYLMKEFGDLDEKVKYILTERYGFNGREPKTLSEIGKTLGLSRERVRQIQAQAEGILREKLEHLRA